MAKLGPYQLNSIITGDARELSKAIPDNSVDLIFTDPVYDRIEDYEWLAETAKRVLREDRACLVWVPTYDLPVILVKMKEYLNYRWQFIEYRTNEVKHRPAPGGKCLYASCLWFDKGKKKPKFTMDIRAISVFSSASNHKWSKPPKTSIYYLERFTRKDDIIFDPFTGGGTVPAVCKILNRQYLAFEIDPENADLARQRVANTQPPLPLVYPDQMEMAL